MIVTTLAVALLAAAQTVSAVGCATHTFGSCSDGIVHWYDPDDGMICDPVDCGGGRAPPKTNNPCCAAYTGTEQCVTSTSYLPCFKAAPSTTPPSQQTSGGSSEVTTTPVTPIAGAPTTMAPSASTSGTHSSAPITSGASNVATTRSPITTTGSNRASSSSSTTTTSTNAAGYVQQGSLMAVAGAIFGAALL